MLESREDQSSTELGPARTNYKLGPARPGPTMSGPLPLRITSGRRRRRFVAGLAHSEMAEMGAAAAAAVPVIPEDVVIEILARVPDPTSLFRCAAACKRWLRLIADQALLRRRWPPGTRVPSLLGFFAQRHQIQANARRKLTKLFPTRAPPLVAAPSRGTGDPPVSTGRRRRLFLTDFVRNAAGAGLFDQAKPLAARGGLLLVRVLPSPSPAPQNALHLCVCNLLTGSHDVLPPLPMDCFEKDGARGYAILTAADHRVSRNPSGGYNTFFQVLLLSIHHGNHQVYLHRFSSAAASAAAAAVIFEISWSTPRNCSEQIRGYVWGPSGNRVAAVSHGGAHWLFSWGEESLYTLDVSIDTDNIGATNIPIDPPPTVFHQSWLYVSVDERLSLLYLCDNKLHIWTKLETQESGRLLWNCTQSICVGVKMGLFGTESLSTVCIGEESGTMLTLYLSDPNSAYVLDLPSGSITSVDDWKRWFNYMTAVSFEINWHSFFLTRLGDFWYA